jgi:hypothetical protein
MLDDLLAKKGGSALSWLGASEEYVHHQQFLLMILGTKSYVQFMGKDLIKTVVPMVREQVLQRMTKLTSVIRNVRYRIFNL